MILFKSGNGKHLGLAFLNSWFTSWNARRYAFDYIWSTVFDN